MSEENYSEQNTFFKCAVIILLAFLVALLGYSIYQNHQQCNSCTYEGYLDEDSVSVDDAVEMFKSDVQYEMNYDKYLKLSPTIIRAIYLKIGTQANVNDIVEEYENNKAYYISLQVQEQLPQVDVSGPDEDNINIIRVIPEINDSVKEEPKVKDISPALPADTL